MNTEPTTTEQQVLTTEQVLNLVINNLFDIPENSQISIPPDSIIKRILLLKAGFMSLEERQRIDTLISDLNNEKTSFLAELGYIREKRALQEELIMSMKTIETNPICEKIKNMEDVELKEGI